MMKILKSLKSLFRRTYRRVRRRLSKTELILILSFVVGTILAITIILVLKKNNSSEQVHIDDTLDISIEESTPMTGDDAAGDTEEITLVETASADTKIESTADTTVLTLKDGAKQGYMNRCVFLGDSRTVAMVNYGLINDDAALAQIGISHPSFAKNTFMNNAGKEYTLKSYLASHQAPVIYIALGVNGINDPSEEHYKKTFNDLIDSVMSQAPNSNVVLMSIGPVDDNGAYKKTVQNSWINKYNDFLLNTAKEKKIFYLNINEVLTGSNGQVRSDYNGGDGLHYSSNGCKAIFDYIVSHPVPGIDDDGEYKVKYIKPNPNRTKVTMDDGSGIDAEKLQELMNMMMEATPTPTSAPTQTTPSPEELKRQEEEKKKKEQEEEEERIRKEEEEKKRLAEEERKRREEEERKRLEEEERNKQNNSGGGTTDPGTTDPGSGTTDPGTTDPGSGTTDPGTTDPGSGTTDPGTTDPGSGTTDPGTTDPTSGTADPESNPGT